MDKIDFKRAKRVKTSYGPYMSDFTGVVKFFDTTVSIAPIPIAGAVADSLNLVPEGTSQSNRIGRKIELIGLEIRGFWETPKVTDTGDPNLGDICRVIVFNDKQPNKAAATCADILELCTLNSPFTMTNVGRFDIYKDWTKDMQYTMVASNNATPGKYSTPAVNGHFIWMIPLPDISIEYDSEFADGRLASITVNNIGILFISIRARAGLALTARIVYTDR